MAYTFQPHPDYSRSTRKGDRGEGVAVLQLNLPPLVVDGIFGLATNKRVRALQRANNLVVDGIAGPATQRAICISRSREAEALHKLPPGTLESIMENESGFILAAYSKHPSDEGIDLGSYQKSIVPGSFTQENFRKAYNVVRMAEETAAKLRQVFERFVSYGVVNTRRAWELAILSHNWPAAAERLAQGKSIFIDPARDDQPAEWVIKASAGRLQTPREWVESYIKNSTKRIRW